MIILLVKVKSFLNFVLLINGLRITTIILCSINNDPVNSKFHHPPCYFWTGWVGQNRPVYRNFRSYFLWYRCHFSILIAWDLKNSWRLTSYHQPGLQPRLILWFILWSVCVFSLLIQNHVAIIFHSERF